MTVSTSRKPLKPSAAVVAAILAVVAASWFSFVAVSTGVCGGGVGTPNVSATSGAADWCRLIDPSWDRTRFYGTESEYRRIAGRNPGPAGPVIGPYTTLDTIRTSLPLMVPIVLVLIGIALAVWRRDRCFFDALTLAAVVAILAPWVAIAILTA
jgi:hypothetical protein